MQYSPFPVAAAVFLLLCGCSEPRPDRPSIGYIDAPLPGAVIDQASDIQLLGWALDGDGIDRVEAVVDGSYKVELSLTKPRIDVNAAFPQFDDSETPGYDTRFDLPDIDPGLHTISLVVHDIAGNTQEVGSQEFTVSGVWPALLAQRPGLKKDRFHIAVGTSNLSQGGGAQIKDVFRRYESETIRAALRVPLLYLRTTRGSENDWEFDPDYAVGTVADGKVVAEDSLSGILDHAVANGLPALISLNGGIWADARGPAVDWDVNDFLELDPVNCQLTEDGEALEDDYLSGLPGSESSPQLARSLTLNVHAEKVRAYKRRNLQAAGRLIGEFAARNPDLLVGVNLDADVYVNPFFHGKQWYDYNPGTIRQFREWLSGSGPYAEGEALFDKRRTLTLSLEEVNRLSGEQFRSWSEVQPPKPSSFGDEQPFWEDEYVGVWQQFRRHLVDLHYDDLAAWVVDTGVPSERVFSAQGFATSMSKHVSRLAVFVDSPAKNYDTGGATIEGSVPSAGHLGAILYGWSASNKVIVDSGDSLFAAIRKFDRAWGVVEYNPAFLEFPDKLPDYATGYRALRDLFNFGAIFVSPMAWNGWNGINEGHPGFRSYTAFRNTPFEKAVFDFMQIYGGLPASSLLWPFGSHLHPDTDGWRVSDGFRLEAHRGAISLTPESEVTELILDSPPGQWVETALYDLLVLGVEPPMQVSGELQLLGKASDAEEWEPVTAMVPIQRLSADGTDITVPLIWLADAPAALTHVRIVWRQQNPFSANLWLRHVAFYPGVPDVTGPLPIVQFEHSRDAAGNGS